MSELWGQGGVVRNKGGRPMSRVLGPAIATDDFRIRRDMEVRNAAFLSAILRELSTMGRRYRAHYTRI
jgi:hypothetical protein